MNLCSGIFTEGINCFEALARIKPIHGRHSDIENYHVGIKFWGLVDERETIGEHAYDFKLRLIKFFRASSNKVW